MTTTCPSEAELRELLLGRGPDSVGEHLADCPRCGAMAGQLVASDPLLADLRAAHDTGDTGTDGTFVEELLRRVRKSPEKPADKELDFLDPARPSFPNDLGMFNHYRIVEKIGQGGMGMVFKAVDTTLERTVALKIILPKYAENAKLRDRFLEEARATVKVRSPHVAEIFETNVWKNVPYLTMELLVGTTLDKRPKPMALDALRRIGFSIAKGLADAHRSGLIHRDLKPSNIHLGTDSRTGKPTVKLIDFGLARPVNREIEITKSGELLGTPAYMSPEQARGKKVDHRTDLYSLGVILHQLATGRLPYDGADAGVMAILTELATPEPLTSVALRTRALPSSLATLIDRLLAKDAANRPASADEVMKILKASLNEKAGASTGTEVVASEPFVSVPDSTGAYEPSMAFSEMRTEPESPREPTRNRSWLRPALGVGAALAVLIVAVLAGAFNVKVKTKDGTVIELVDLPDGSEVSVDGEVVAVSWNAGKTKAEVRVKPGTRTLEVKKDGFRVTGEEITLAEGERKPFTVRLEKLELGAKPASEPNVVVPAVVTSGELVVNGNADQRLQGWNIKEGRWNPMGPDVRDPFFRPGNCKSALIQQDVPVAEYGADIDAGLVEFQFSGLISCYTRRQKDKARIAMIFLDADKKEIDVAYNSGFVSESIWKEYGGTRKPKVGTRYVRIVLHSQRDGTVGNQENSGYYDNISLKAVVTKNTSNFAKLPAYRPGETRFLGIGYPKLSRFDTGPEAHANLLLAGLDQVFIDAARRAKRNVVLVFQGRARKSIETALYPLIEKNRDTVAGVLWSLPYPDGYEPSEVGAFGAELKKRFPGLSYLVSFVEKPLGQHETKPVPAEVDFVVVASYSNTSAHAVRAKADDVLPEWIKKADGRPVILFWTAWSQTATGILPQTQPGTFRAYLDAARKHKIAGIAFHPVFGGGNGAHLSIDSNPALLKELDDVGREMLAMQAPVKVDYTNALDMKFVRVPKGKAWLAGDANRNGDREVNMADDFFMGIHEVTQSEWQKVMGKNPSHFSRTGEGKDAVKAIDDATLARFPVEMVSFNDCQEFLTKLNEQAKETGWTYRLPTWEEWEYACRGGPMKDIAESRSNFYLAGPINSLTALQANYRITGHARTVPVGSYPPNKLGLYDMHGNVWEFLHAAAGPDQCKGFGNSWNNETHELRNAWGSPIPRTAVGNNMGLRVVRVPAAVAPAPAPRTIDLLALVDVSRDVVKGTWTRGPDGISSDNSAFCRIKIPYKPLPAEYDYRVEFTAKGAGNDVLQLLSAGGTNFSFLMGAWGGKWDGFDAVTGHPLMRAGTNIVGGPTFIKANTRHTVVISVRKDSVSATIDGKLVVKHATNYADLRMPNEWNIGDGLLGLGTTIDPTIFHKAELVDVTPAAVPVPMAVPAPTPAPKSAGNFSPLFNGKDIKDWVRFGNPKGEWTIENGVLKGRSPLSNYWGGAEIYRNDIKFREFHLRIEATPSVGNPSRIYLFCNPMPGRGNSDHDVWLGPGNKSMNHELGRLWYPLARNPNAHATLRNPPPAVKAGEWYTMDIVYKGRRLTVDVNGTRVTDETNMDVPPAKRVPFIVDAADGGSISFRKIEIKELK